MSILLTGVLGYIASHVCVELLQLGHSIIGIDNLASDRMKIFDEIIKLVPNADSFHFVKMDLTNKSDLIQLFQTHKIHFVIHFAGLKSVSESIQDPLTYYFNNFYGSLNLLQVMKQFNCYKLIFSSSATVYGTQTYPVDETCATGQGITNPYGRTKYFIEEMLKDLHQSEPNLWNIVILRYFNPVGGLPSLQEDNGTNLFTHLIHHAKNKTCLQIFGENYDTSDGTCVRDFIDVVDLAKAHLITICKLQCKPNLCIYNLGTGKGTTILEFVNNFMKVNQVKIKCVFTNPRKGDLPIVFANVDKIAKELHWQSSS